jgi:hypothetical protein
LFCTHELSNAENQVDFDLYTHTCASNGHSASQTHTLEFFQEPAQTMPKNLVDYKDLYETLHFHELESRERVSGRLQVSLGLVVALAGAISFLVGQIDYGTNGIAFKLFLAVLIGSTGCLLWASWHLKCVFWGNTYKEATYGDEIRAHEVKLHEYYHSDKAQHLLKTGPCSTADEAFTNHFQGFLVDRFAKSAGHNGRVNDERSKHLHRANRAILFTAAAAFVAFIIFTFGNYRSTAPTEVRLVSPAEISVVKLPDGAANQGLTCEQARAQICATTGPTGATESRPNERQEQKPSAAAPSAREGSPAASSAPK